MIFECKLVCGYEELNLNQHTVENWVYRCAMDGFNPQTAQPSDDVLNTSGYDDVLETMVLQIQAATKTAIMAARHTLVTWLYRAKQFMRGETQYPTILKFKLDGMSDYQYAMLIPESGDPELIGQPSNFVQSVNQLLIADVTIQVRRRPILLDDVSVTAGSDQVLQGSVMTITLGNISDVPTPSRAQFDGLSASQSVVDGYVLATTGQNTLNFGLSFNFWSNPNGTLQVINEMYAHGLQVARWTPATTNPCLISTIPFVNTTTSFLSLLVVRNNTANKRYLIRPCGFHQTTSSYILGKATVFDVPAGEISLIPLGLVFSTEVFGSAGVWVQPIDTGGTLDFDVLYTLQGDAYPQLIDVRSVSLPLLGTSGTALELILDSEYLTGLDASAIFRNLANTKRFHCEGYANQTLYTYGQTINLALILRSFVSGSWSWGTGGNRPLLTAGITAPKASLHPR